jgi:hypothetical protein
MGIGDALLITIGIAVVVVFIETVTGRKLLP